MSAELASYVKLTILFYKFFCRRHSLMGRPCYSNLFQIMQHDNFRNLNRVIFTQLKHLSPQLMPFDTARVKAIKRYAFQDLMKSVSIPRNQSSFEILQLFDTLRYQSLVILFLSCFWL